MRRREFITFATGAAAWPLLARAQQTDQMRRIGYLTGGNRDNAEIKERLSAFTGELQNLGWTEGRNVRIDVRASGGDAATTRQFAKELVALKPDIGYWQPACGLNARNNAHSANCVCASRRSSRCRNCR